MHCRLFQTRVRAHDALQVIEYEHLIIEAYRFSPAVQRDAIFTRELEWVIRVHS